MSTLAVTKDAIRIKVIQHSVGEVESQCCRFSIAPELTSYEVLRNLISRAFDIKGGKFNTSYLARDDRFPEACWVPLGSDFDLDLAFHKSSDPNLLIKVELGETGGIWKVSSNIDLSKLSLPNLPKTNYSSKLPFLFKEKVEKTISVIQNAFAPAEESDPTPPRPPLLDVEFQGLLDKSGALKDSRELRLRVYLGGVEPSLRKVVWKHLLNVYPDNLTGKERIEYMKELTNEYYKLRTTWQTYLKEAKNVTDEVKYTTNMVIKDVLRTDRLHPFFSGPDDSANVTSLYNILTTYALNHPSIGYCQGMSDLASPLLVTMKDEAQAFVCFCALMRRLGPNFHIDGEAMTLKFQHLTEALVFYDPEFFSYLQQHQAEDLLFCYRWLLLELKREFAFESAQLMLEVLWSTLPPNPPSERLVLIQELFQPEGDASLATPSPQRLNHFATVRALWRKRSSLRSDSVARLLRRRATSIDVPQTGCLAHSPLRRSHTLQAGAESSSETASDSETSPSKGKKVRDLKEFRLLISKKHEPSTTTKEEDSIVATNGKDEGYSKGRRCLSDSDANNRDISVFKESDLENDIWEKEPIDPLNDPSYSKLSSDKPIEQFTPRTVKPTEHAPRASAEPIENTPRTTHSKSVSPVTEALEPGWKISMSGDYPTMTLPPPHELGGGNPFLIFLCVTLLIQQSRFIIENGMDHNELAMHFDKLVRSHNVHKVLAQARKWFEVYLRISSKRDDSSPDDASAAQESC